MLIFFNFSRKLGKAPAATPCLSRGPPRGETCRRVGVSAFTGNVSAFRRFANQQRNDLRRNDSRSLRTPTRRHAEPLIRSPWCLLFVTIFVLAQPSRTLGQLQTWNNPSGGSWLIGTNWSPNNQVPNSTSYSATIGLNAFVTLSGSNTLAISSLNVGDNLATYTSGSLSLSTGANLTTVNTDIGIYESPTEVNAGTLTVDGSGTSFTDSFYMQVGFGGTGTVNVNNSATFSGAAMYVGNSFQGHAGTGTVNIDGAGSTMTSTGAILGLVPGTMGTLNVRNGGFFSIPSGDLDVGGGGTGIATLTSGATMNLNNLYVGLGGGTGTLTVDGAGTTTPTMTTSGTAYIGLNGGAVGTAYVQNGGVWKALGTLGVGAGGTGTLNITNRGVVTASAYFSVSGTITIDGTGSTLNVSGDSAIQIGTGGPGNVTVQNGGSVVFGAGAGTVFIGTYTGAGNSSLTVTGTGSNVTLAGQDVAIAANFQNPGTGTDGGTLSLVAGGKLTVPSPGRIFLGGSPNAGPTALRGNRDNQFWQHNRHERRSLGIGHFVLQRQHPSRRQFTDQFQ